MDQIWYEILYEFPLSAPLNEREVRSAKALGTSPEDAIKNAGLERNQTARATPSSAPHPVRNKGNVVWTDISTGEQLHAREDFIEKLPTLLPVGEQNARHVDDLLAAMGVTADQKSARRQLRNAKEYLVQEKNLPICSLRSRDGGYFLATCAEDLLHDARTYRASAAGMITAAEMLERLSQKLFGGLSEE